MSKIKDELQRIQEIEHEQYISFMEWVCDQKIEVSESDAASEVEEGSREPSTSRTSIVAAKTLKPANNINYNPQIGA